MGDTRHPFTITAIRNNKLKALSIGLGLGGHGNMQGGMVS